MSGEARTNSSWNCVSKLSDTNVRVITASISGRTAYVGEPIYIATKWALVGLSKALRKEARPAGVRVRCSRGWSCCAGKRTAVLGCVADRTTRKKLRAGSSASRTTFMRRKPNAREVGSVCPALAGFH